MRPSSPSPSRVPLAVQSHEPRLRELGYELLEALGSGGMGEVWRARDLKLDRDVAIKFVAATAGGPRAYQRFQVEARALARIKHENVVTVYQLGELEELPFLVYELVEGTALDELLSELSWEQALMIAIDLARGLAAAHQAGVLHRDIKPANAMLTADGVAKLIDFGLAKLGGELPTLAAPLTEPLPEPGRDPSVTVATLEVSPDLTADLSADLQAPPSPASEREQGLTQADALLGTPRYVAPELWLGKPASPATDVYALALIAWEMLSNRHAHAGVERAELARTIVDLPLPKLSELRPDIPAELAAIVDRGVSKRPLDRFRTADEFCAALERLPTPEFVSGPLVGVRPGGGLARRRSEASRSQANASGPSVPTRWIRAGELSLALQQFGEGPSDVLYIPSWVSHCEAAWRFPPYASFMARLGRLARVTVFDKRGTGMSDRLNAPVPIEQRMLDIPAILDALELESAVLLGVQDGGAIASMFAACNPERVRGLIWYGSARRLLAADDYPFGMPEPMFAEIRAACQSQWGTPLFADFAAPSLAHDGEFLAWWAEFQRNGASPGTATWMLDMNATMDIAPVLRAIGVPTLVAHRRGDRMMPLPGGKMVAEGILDARWCELEGDDHLPWVGDSTALLAAIAEFLGELDQLPRHPRRLLSLLATAEGVQRCRGPVDALHRALRGNFDGPALVDVGASDSPLEQTIAERLASLPDQTTGSVFASSSAALLAGGSGLSFEPVVSGAAGPLSRVRVRAGHGA